MSALLVALALAHAPAAPAEDPRAVVQAATRAVEEEGTAPLRVRWQEQLERSVTDRGALLGLATLARLTYDYATADALYRRLAAADAAPPGRFTAYALLGQAWALEEQGFSNGAEAQFEGARRAALRVRDGLAEAEALIALSFVSGRMSGVPAAMRLLDRAGKLIPPTAFDLEADLLRHRAVLLGVAGSPDALADAEAGISAARRSGVRRVEAQALRAAGKVMNFRAQNEAASAYFRRSEEAFRNAHEHSWLAATLTEHAGSLLELGELGEGRETLRAARAEGEASLVVTLGHLGLR